MQLTRGARLGAYEILEPLSAGGMGELYKARDTRLDRTVAIKTLLPHLSTVPEFRERFEREARAVAALKHPHICPLHDIGHHDGLDFLVMEFVDGQTLARRLKAGIPAFHESLRYLREIADALDHAHRHGVVHRDIKPSNILLDGEGRVKLADFGIARQISSEDAALTRITAEGRVVGTPSYMSPEQVRQAAVGPPSDIFSLGCLMHELVTGAPPFERASAVETMHAVLTAPPRALTGPGLPPEFVTLLEHVLDKDPDKRPSARAVSDALAALIGTGQVLGATPTHVVSWTGRRPWPSLVAGGALVAGLAIAGVWGWQALMVKPALSFEAHETVLMGPPANLSDDSALGDVLRTALQISLEQSPYVNVLSPQRVHEALTRMRAGDEALTERAALEICQREGVKALIGSGVERVGEQFVLTARIIDPATGSSVRTLSERAAGRGQILAAADRLASSLRRTLGESLRSINSSSIVLAQATTASLDALKLYTQASDLRARGRVDEARTLLERALALDPEFARAYADLATTYKGESGVIVDPARAEHYFQEALKRLDNVGERERFEIRALYSNVMEKWEDAIPLYRSLVERYPAVDEYHRALGIAYRSLRRYPLAIAELQEAVKLNPRSAPAMIALATCHSALGETKEEVIALERAFALEPEWETDDIQNHQYGWALIQIGDEARARAAYGKMLAKGGTAAARGHRSLGILALYRGRLNEARRELLEAARINDVSNNGVSAARDLYYLAEALTLVDRRDDAAVEIARGVDLLKRDAFVQAWLALRFAALWSRAGRPAEAARLIEILRPKVGKGAIEQADALRTEGELALARGSIEAGIEMLRRAVALQAWWLTRSSLAHALAGSGNSQEAIDLHRRLITNGPEPWEGHVDWAVMHVRLARLYEQVGDTSKARQMYLALIEQWKDADADLEPLREARDALPRLSK